jgi:gamma-glutamylcyclotransferase (GGCT)/AIG2-like uncharacterized protein YtfP
MINHKLFVYNDLRAGDDLFKLLTAEKVASAVYPAGHSRLVSLGKVPGMLPDRDGGGIVGTLYVVPTYTLEAVDKMEAVPHLMRRVKIKVKAVGQDKLVRAWAYVLANPASWANRGTIASGDWYKHAYAPVQKTGAPYLVSTSKADDDEWWDNYMGNAQADNDRPAASDVEIYADRRYSPFVRDSLKDLKEGSILTVTTKDGKSSTYKRVSGKIRTIGTVVKVIPEAPKPVPEPPNEACGIGDKPPEIHQPYAGPVRQEEHYAWCMHSLNKGSCDCKAFAADDEDESICISCGEPIFWADVAWGWLGPNASPDCAYGRYHTPGVFDRRRRDGEN